MSVFGVFLVRIFPHSNQKYSEYEHFSRSVILSSFLVFLAWMHWDSFNESLFWFHEILKLFFRFEQVIQEKDSFPFWYSQSHCAQCQIISYWTLNFTYHQTMANTKKTKTTNNLFQALKFLIHPQILIN